MTEAHNARLWKQKTETVQNRCMMVAERIKASGFQFTFMDGTLGAELEQFASLMEGRIMVIDHNYRILKDTFGIEDNRYLMTEDVLKVMAGEKNVLTNRDGQYVEIVYPVTDSTGTTINGVICVISSCSCSCSALQVCRYSINFLDFTLFKTSSMEEIPIFTPASHSRSNLIVSC